MPVTVDEAKSDFAKLLTRLKAGEEEVIIAEEGRPVARLLPVVEKPKQCVPGTAIGKVVIPPEFFDPLPDEIVDECYA